MGCGVGRGGGGECVFGGLSGGVGPFIASFAVA